MSLEIVSCPECGLVAEVTRRDWLASTAGPVEHVRIRCVQRHWFLMPADGVAGACTTASSAAAFSQSKDEAVGYYGGVIPPAERSTHVAR